MDCVSIHLPELKNYVIASYATAPSLFFGKYIIESSCGVQQGDPLGPLLFALSIRHITHSSIAPFVVWYLDDVTVGGSAEEVSRELLRIGTDAEFIGLGLNNSKCEIATLHSSAIYNLIPECKVSATSHSELLGAPLTAEASYQILKRRAATLEAITPGLTLICRNDAQALLRCSLGHPRAIYDLLAGPCFASTAGLADFDKALREAFVKSVCRT